VSFLYNKLILFKADVDMTRPQLNLNTAIYSVEVSSTRKGGYRVAMNNLLPVVMPYEHEIGSGNLFAMFKLVADEPVRRNFPVEYALDHLHSPAANSSDFKNMLFAEKADAQAYFDKISAANAALAQAELLETKEGREFSSKNIQIGDLLYVVDVQARHGMQSKISRCRVTSIFSSADPRDQSVLGICRLYDKEDTGYACSLSFRDYNIDQVGRIRSFNRCFLTPGAAQAYLERITCNDLTGEEQALYRSMTTIVVGGGIGELLSQSVMSSMMNNIEISMLDQWAMPLIQAPRKSAWPVDRWGRHASGKHK
jgi:hypothetical protein